MTDATRISRRTVLAASGAGGALLLAACASPGGAPDGGGSTGTGGGSGSGGPSGGASPDSLEPGTELAALSAVPVGGSASVTVDGVPLLIAQPSAGAVVAFSAICTHQGCVVAAGAEFDCPCHGSRYDAATGEVLQGPAPDPLPPVAVRVDGDRIVAGAA